ncbi:MAG: hypothetical protein RLY50_1103, partial [Actinomycetota bacterium]
RATPAPVPQSVVVASAATGRIAAGRDHTCGIDPDGAVWCWGDNLNGKLGDPTFTSGRSESPRRAAALPDGRVAEQIVAGTNHTCVRANDNTVWCWGASGAGQLGHVGLTGTSPTQVGQIQATTLGAGGNTTCAALTDGTARCWGLNDVGQWGDSTTSATPALGTLGVVSGVTSHPGGGQFSMESVDIGTSHVCAVAGSGATWCWGSAANGRLGSSSPTDASTPRGTATLPAAAVQTAVGGAHTCVALADGTVSCFGLNNEGELGSDSTSVSSSDAPLAVTGLSNVSRVTAGDEFTCAVASGQVRCFGANWSGQLGDGTSTPRHSSAPVSNIAGTAVDVVAGEFHACAVTETEDVWCWGLNRNGQLGIGNRVSQTSPQKISGLAIGTTTTTTTTSTTTTSTTTTTIVGAAPPTGSTGESPIATPAQSPTHTSAASADVAAAATTTTTPKKSVAASSPSRRVSVRRTRSLSASRIAAAAGLAIPRRSKGSMRITLVKGRDRCRFVGSSVRGVKRGTCSLRVVLIPKKGRTISRTVTVRVT